MRFITFSVLLGLSFSSVANSIYLVRHAEKQASGADPALTLCGQGRADALAAYFSEHNLAAVFSTDYQRTKQTAAAVAASKQLAVTDYDPRQPATLVQQLKLAQQLKNNNQSVLVVGHSNTVPELVTLLSGIQVSPLTEQDYDMLYQVKLAANPSLTISRQAYRCQNKE